MIAILDYGVGNLFSLRSSLQQLGLQAVVTADAAVLRAADLDNPYGRYYGKARSWEDILKNKNSD